MRPSGRIPAAWHENGINAAVMISDPNMPSSSTRWYNGYPSVLATRRRAALYARLDMSVSIVKHCHDEFARERIRMIMTKPKKKSPIRPRPRAGVITIELTDVPARGRAPEASAGRADTRTDQKTGVVEECHAGGHDPPRTDHGGARIIRGLDLSLTCPQSGVYSSIVGTRETARTTRGDQDATAGDVAQTGHRIDPRRWRRRRGLRAVS